MPTDSPLRRPRNPGRAGVFTVTAGIALLLALMYAQTAWTLIVHHHVEFIGYKATEPNAQWVVANLGARLLGIAAGLVIAVVLRNERLLALMFAVRLVADVCDLLISATTVGMASFVPIVLGCFASIESACLIALLTEVRKSKSAG